MEKSLRSAWKSAPSHDVLSPLAKGLLASSVAGPNAFPFRSIRRLVDGLTWWEKGWDYLGADPGDTNVPQGPSFSWDNEVEGIAYDADHMYLVSRDALWAVRRHEGAPSKKIPVSEISIIDNDGLHYEGRRQLFDVDAKVGPKHLSAPSVYHGKLVVPAEGALRADRQQWLWVFDTTTLGYLGRVGLDADESGLSDEIAWCSADEESGLLYASRCHDPGYVAVFRLPPLSKLLASGPSGMPAIVVEESFPTIYAKFVGKITLTDFDGTSPALSEVQGGVVTPSGHLYVAFMKAGGDTAWGVLGFDLLTGQAIRYIPLGSADEFGSFQLLQGIAFSENQLRVLFWDPDASHNEYSVFNFGLKDAGEIW